MTQHLEGWRELRQRAGLSLRVASDLAGLNRGRVSEIENRWRVPTPNEAEALLRVYGRKHR